jgi:hypothetical protein
MANISLEMHTIPLLIYILGDTEEHKIEHLFKDSCMSLINNGDSSQNKERKLQFEMKSIQPLIFTRVAMEAVMTRPLFNRVLTVIISSGNSSLKGN